jgi:hypothetical protein
MMEADETKRVMDAVSNRYPGCRNQQVRDIHPRFLEGALYTVAFEVEGAGEVQGYENKVYVTKKRIEVFASDGVLVDRIGQITKRSLVDRVTEVEGVAGLIALVLTATVCYLSISLAQVPDILSNALSVVLGFYFAKASTR